MKANKISTEQTILRLLKKESHSYLSGQALSKAFGISRTVKDMGYDIEASPAIIKPPMMERAVNVIGKTAIIFLWISKVC